MTVLFRSRAALAGALVLIFGACAVESASESQNGGESAGTGGAPGGGGGSQDGDPASGGSTGSGGEDPGIGGAVGMGGGSGGDGPVGCAARTDLLICEDFESTSVGSIPDGWTSEGNVAVADDFARGERSLKVGAANNGPRRIGREASVLGAAHWGRIHYRVMTPTPTSENDNEYVHSTLVELNGTGPDLGNAWYRVVDTVQDPQRQHQFLFNVQPASSGEFGKGSSYDWAFEAEWHCAEWHVDGNQQRYRFFFDGDEVTQIAIDNGAGNYGSNPNRTHLPLSYASLSVGWYNYQVAPPGFVAWLDDLAIGTERVGCE